MMKKAEFMKYILMIKNLHCNKSFISPFHTSPLWKLLCFMEQNVAVEKLIISQPIEVLLNRRDVVTETLGLNTQFTAKMQN